MLATATLAAGECTKDKCGKCAANTGATVKYCTRCVGAAIFGTAENRTCVGGTAITGCLEYMTTDDTANGTVYCSKCDASKNYYSYVATGAAATTAVCKLCDLSVAEKYLKQADGTCATATAVTDCASYTNAGLCATCKNSKTINDASPPACSTSITNCVLIDGATTTKCKTAAPKFHVKADGTVGANIANCDVAVQTDDATKAAQCTTCSTGFFKSSATARDALTVANCASSTGTKDNCSVCKAGFTVKADNSACTATPPVLKCKTCDVAGGYFATDVDGTAKIGTDWAQTCTKTTVAPAGGSTTSSQIVAISVMVLAMISNF